MGLRDRAGRPAYLAPCGVMTAAKIAAMTAATGARTDGTTAATGVPDPGCCGDSYTPRRTRNPPNEGRAGSGQAHEHRRSGAIWLFSQSRPFAIECDRVAVRHPDPSAGELGQSACPTPMGQVILLSLTASFNPTLVAATTVMLLLDNPAKLMLGYLLGAYVTSITLGLVIVFSASNSGTTNTTENTLSPAVDIALGAIALFAAWVVWSGRHERYTHAGGRARRRSPTRVRRGGSGS